MTDAQLLTLITASITSGNSNTTAQLLRDTLDALVNNKQNIDGKNVASGYPGLNASGHITTSQLAVASPAGAVLFDNGTFKKVSKGNKLFSGDGSTTSFQIAHGLGLNPSIVLVTPGSQVASAAFWVTHDATIAIVNYVVAPLLGTNNISLDYFMLE